MGNSISYTWSPLHDWEEDLYKQVTRSVVLCSVAKVKGLHFKLEVFDTSPSRERKCKTM